MSRALPLVLALAACGRVGFDADRGDGGTAPGDAGFFGAARCPAGVLLCDSFEEPQIDASLWKVATVKGAAVLDSTHAARGLQALHVSGVVTNNEVQSQLIYDDTAVGGLPNPVYLRVFVYLTQLPPSSNETVAWLYDNAGNNGVQIEASAHGSIAYDGWGVSNADKESSTLMPLDQWVCLEWMLSAGEMSMWMNDVAVGGMQDASWTTPPSPEKVAIGLQYTTSPGLAIDAWIDEVIADGSRIGCAK